MLGGVLGVTLITLGITGYNAIAWSESGDVLPNADADAEIAASRSLTNPGVISSANTGMVSGDLKNTPDAKALSDPIKRAVRVRKNDTLSKILTRAGVAPNNAYKATTALATKFKPRDLKIGQTLELTLVPDQRIGKAGQYTLTRLSMNADIRNTIVVSRKESGEFNATVRKRTLVVHNTRRGSIIHSSLYLAGQRARAPAKILAELTHIFSFDVDFQRDVQSGDAFAVLYERLSDESGDTVGFGSILIAEMTLSGKNIRLFRHQSKDGDTDYYTAKGESVRKALTLTPIDGARISSGYGRRKHPILGYTKMHRGVDFSAPRGTPIYAAGRGVVEFAGRNGSYGKYIRIRHNGAYKTAYAHMKGLARGIRKGRRVKQGQVIGYVGTTGRSTGPHLHYEILKNGRQVNPRRLNLPSGRKLRGAELARFQTVRARLEKQYAAAPTGTQIATNPTPPSN